MPRRRPERDPDGQRCLEGTRGNRMTEQRCFGTRNPQGNRTRAQRCSRTRNPRGPNPEGSNADRRRNPGNRMPTGSDAVSDKEPQGTGCRGSDASERGTRRGTGREGSDALEQGTRWASRSFGSAGNPEPRRRRRCPPGLGRRYGTVGVGGDASPHLLCAAGGTPARPFSAARFYEIRRGSGAT